MSKVLAVGDMHLKQEIILPRVDVLAERYEVDRVVLLGDYCDEWRADDDMCMRGLYRLADWVDEGRSSGLRVDVLLGNHDYQYLLGEEGPGTHVALMGTVRALLIDLEPVIAVENDGFLFTHAGVTDSWAERYLNEPCDAADACVQLNDMYQSSQSEDRCALAACGPGRGGWDTPSPLWADCEELREDPFPGIGQIVGHTPLSTCESGDEGFDAFDADERLWFCDTFSLNSSMRPLGDGSMLLIDDGNVSVVGGEDDCELEPWEDSVAGWLRN